MAKLRRMLLPLVLLMLVAAGLVVSFMPRPVAVDTAVVDEGPLMVTVNEDGRTRVKERYDVFSPLAGQLARIPLKSGASLEAGKTLIAAIDPSDPALLDARAVAETEARVKAAMLFVERAQANVTAANAAQEFATSELARMQQSIAGGAATPREEEDKRLTVTLRTQEARAAEFGRQIAKFELEQAQAALLRTRPEGTAGEAARLTIVSPIDGRVLRVLRESAGFVLPGTALLEIGDSANLEIEVDVLSSDAVRIERGAMVIIEGWGGSKPLNGRVRMVEPAAFTKVSALGVEEQRVNVIIDFVDPPEQRAGLGDGYRVNTRIVIAQTDRTLRAPTGALFRHGEHWATFVVSDGHAHLRELVLGRRNDRDAEVISGLNAGETVVVYPSDRVVEGVRLAPRPASGR